jgi:hypothetical protein
LVPKLRINGHIGDPRGVEYENDGHAIALS